MISQIASIPFGVLSHEIDILVPRETAHTLGHGSFEKLHELVKASGDHAVLRGYLLSIDAFTREIMGPRDCFIRGAKQSSYYTNDLLEKT